MKADPEPPEREMAATVREIRASVQRHSTRFEKAIPLIASENLLSPYAKELLISDFHSRYAEGLPGERYYEGNEEVDRVERTCLELARRLFRCSFADVRPISGTVANLAVLKALAEPGDPVGTARLADGAHISSASFGAFGLRGVKPVYYAWDEERMTLDVPKTRAILREARPKLCLFGLSLFLFPIPIEELRPTLEEIGAHGWYDAAHVLGLIAGGEFQDPLHEGCEVISASTHKTLPGPQHGLLLGETRDPDVERRLRSAAFPGVTSNHHLHTMAALAVSLAEHIAFGRDYARQVVANARALGQALYERGFDVLAPGLGFTRSHTIAVRVVREGGGEAVARSLAEAGIITNKNLLPGDSSPKRPGGIRIGTPEVTRVGMREPEMVRIAELLDALLHKGRPPAEVRADGERLKADHTALRFCFGAGEAAYRFYDLVGRDPGS
ncbi:MAG: serine hydroxymethyltransferase [Thermoplasmata archaeon]|nr:serine hydroxymethyltransferase [Thermoplasmata archaeon]MCI4359609.1 serine hydroxymethyltransferase [Thermoplasmata archaeon]